MTGVLVSSSAGISGPLSGAGVLVTRSAHQAGALADGILAAGGHPVLFPVLEILDVEDLQPLHDVIARLDGFDLAIFVSPNAVHRVMPLIRQTVALPAGLQFAVVGKGSARALQEYGVQESIVPSSRFDSEALLELDVLQQMQGRKVVIFRGDAGRELLGETLVQRGAVVEYIACYRRIRPATDLAALLASQGHAIHAVMVTSSEGLRNLYDMAGGQGRPWLEKTPLFVSHERIADTARKLGIASVILTPPGDDGLLRGLLDYFGAMTGCQTGRVPTFR